MAPQPDFSLKLSQKSGQLSVPTPSVQLSSSGSSSSTVGPTAGPLMLQAPQCSLTKACQQPPIVFLPKLVYDMVTATDSSGLPKAASLLPSHSVMWASSFRPLLSKTMTSTEQSLYYRQWTVPRPSHMDYSNRAEGRVDSFHPRRLLLSGPPQVGQPHCGLSSRWGPHVHAQWEGLGLKIPSNLHLLIAWPCGRFLPPEGGRPVDGDFKALTSISSFA